MHDDFDRCYRAVQSKDSRFDGWFVTAVLTTGIYCRPSCPVRLPLARNVHFYPSAAAAQRAGFRACKRCRPDASPGSPEWNVRGDAVARAMRLITDGVVDRDGVVGLAARVGYTSRQLERMLQAEVGAGPLALARAQRVQTARVLIETTDLPFSDIAFAAGFASIRQFNDTVRSACDTTPTALRHKAAARQWHDPAPGGQTLTLRLPVRTPFAYEGLFGHLAATAVPGCEEIRDGAYRRTLSLPSGYGIVSLTPRPDHVSCTLILDERARSGHRHRPVPAAPGPRRRPGGRHRGVELGCRSSRRWSPRRPDSGFPARSTSRSWPCGRCWASRCRRRPPAPMPVVWCSAYGTAGQRSRRRSDPHLPHRRPARRHRPRASRRSRVHAGAR